VSRFVAQIGGGLTEDNRGKKSEKRAMRFTDSEPDCRVKSLDVDLAGGSVVPALTNKWNERSGS